MGWGLKGVLKRFKVFQGIEGLNWRAEGGEVSNEFQLGPDSLIAICHSRFPRPGGFP